MANTQMLRMGTGGGEIQLRTLAYEEASYTSILLCNLGAAGTSMPTGQTLQVPPWEWPRVRGGEMTPSLPTVRQYTWLVTASSATHQSAAVVAGKSGESANGSQQLKQAIVTQANEYVDPLLPRPTFSDQLGESSNHYLSMKHLAGTDELNGAGTAKDLEKPYNRRGKFKPSQAAMVQSHHPSPKPHLAKHGA